MNKFKYILPIFVFALAFTFPINTFAGGGPVGLSSFPLRPFDQTQAFILQTDVYSSQPCTQLNLRFSLKDFSAGDSIDTFPTPLDGTYITRHFQIDNGIYKEITYKEVCTSYSIVKSGRKSQRTAVVEAFVNGKQETRETPLAFGDDDYSKQIQGFGRYNDYDNSPQPDIMGEKYLGGPKREVSLQWQKIPWATKYSVYAREANAPAGSEIFLVDTDNTNAIIDIASDLNFYISVVACKTNDTCKINQDSNYTVYLSRMKNKVIGSTEVVNNTNNQTQTSNTPAPQVNTSSGSNEKKVQELNDKVASLEAQVKVSDQKQNLLEEKINQLIAFIKSVFPFFK